MATVTESQLVKKLHDAGLLPPETRRIVIDIQYDCAVMIYCESFADEKTLDIVIESLMSDPKGFQVKPISEKDVP